MEDTYSNLVKENQLLRAQLDAMRTERRRTMRLDHRSRALAQAIYWSATENFDAVVATVVEPSETAVEIYAGKRPAVVASEGACFYRARPQQG